MSPNVQMEKLKPGHVKRFSHSHPAGMWQGCDPIWSAHVQSWILTSGLFLGSEGGDEGQG